MKPFRATRPQVDFATGLSFVARFERLKEDMAHIAQIIGVRKLRLKHKNSSGDPTCYRDKMTARTPAIIAEFYREDIERFGYN